MRLLWLESRLVKPRGQIYTSWDVLPLLEAAVQGKVARQALMVWTLLRSVLEALLSWRSMLQALFPPLKHISISLSRPRESFSKTPLEFSGLWRGVTMSEQLLWSKEDGAFPHCSFTNFSVSLGWGRAWAVAASSSQLPSSSELLQGIYCGNAFPTPPSRCF